MKSVTLNEYLSLFSKKLLKQTEREYFHCDQKDAEITTTKILFNLLKQEIGTDTDIAGFFFDTNINIVSDFDILRFTKSSVVNIELKSELRDQKVFNEVCKKFKNQNRILKIIQSENNINNIYNILFLNNNDQYNFYMYDSSNNTLNLITIGEVITYLEPEDSNNVILDNLIEKLAPSKYLIDPIKHNDEFIDKRYYLTPQQLNLEKQILNGSYSGNRQNILGIEGSAGTGKTLVTLDLAKKLANNGNNILFIFSGTIKEGHKSLEKKLTNVTFKQANDINNLNLSLYDYIIIDEAQRLYDDQIRIIGTFAGQNPNKIIIIAYDRQQQLSVKDKGLLLENLCNNKFSLTNKIRSNQYISYFINKIMYTSKINKSPQIDTDKLSNYITVKFFDSPENAKPWIKKMVNKGFSFIKPSGNMQNNVTADNYQDIPSVQDTHDVIGNQISNVITYVDECLIYKDSWESKKEIKSLFILRN